MAKNRRKKLITVLKVLGSVLLIYLVVTKIDLPEVSQILKKTQVSYLFLVLLFFIISKLLAAFRLNLYFHCINAPLSQTANLKLYLLGMFYNLFLPGGIGGDAYKGYRIQKDFQVSTKRVIAVLVLDRLSGLLLLFMYACVLALLLEPHILKGFKGFFLIGIMGGLVGFWWINKQFFRYVFPIFWKSLSYSVVVQLAQLISLFFILKALHITWGIVPYLFIFLISSLVAVLPLTIGGIGSREVTFYYGAKWLSLDANASVSISMMFFLITALVSVFGIFHHFKKLDLDTEEQRKG